MLKIDQRFQQRPDMPEDTEVMPAGFPGETVVEAAFTWIPRHLVPYPQPLINSGIFRGMVNNKPVEVQTIKERGNFIVLPRRLVSAAIPRTSVYEMHKDYTRDRVHFQDNITPRDAKQERAWAAMKENNAGILSIVPGGGKTVLGLKKAAQCQEPVLIFVNSEMLMEQWVCAAKEFLHLEDADIGYVRGQTAQWERPFVLAMLQTVAGRAESIPMWVRQRFGLILFDEVHHLAAETFSKVASLFYGRRIGLSATWERNDGLEGVYIAHLGPVFFSDNEAELMAHTYFRVIQTPEPDPKLITLWDGSLSIAGLYNYLAADPVRNRLIAKDALEALSAGRRVLVLSHSIAHVEQLGSVIAGMKGGPVGVITSKITGKDKGTKRLDILKNNQLTVATFNLAKEGLNVPALDAIMFATPFKEWGAFTQAKGRAERRHPGKQAPIAVMYEDENIGVSTAMCRSLRRNLSANRMPFTRLKD